jgi:hypothetical protein
MTEKGTEQGSATQSLVTARAQTGRGATTGPVTVPLERGTLTGPIPSSVLPHTCFCHPLMSGIMR